MIRIDHPGSGSCFLPIPDPGVIKAPDSVTLLYLRGFLSGFRSDGCVPGQAGPQAHQAVRRHQRGRQEALHHLSAGTAAVS